MPTNKKEECKCKRIDKTYPLSDLVKPEGVGEWDKLMEDFVFVESRGVRKFVVDKVISLLLQEKAKWKGEVKEKLERRIKDIGNSETINGAISALKGGREGIAYGMVCGLDEVITLIDKL